MVLLLIWTATASAQKPAANPGSPSTRPTSQPAAAWGEAVDGVQASLQTSRLTFKSTDVAMFSASVRNQGQKDLLVTRTQELCELELDGAWYLWFGDVDAKASSFGPSQLYENIRISLDGPWQATTGGARLKLTPGHHVLRVAFFPDAFQVFEKPLRVVSNPIEFDIVQNLPVPPPPK
jgi:hypothetical protein